MNDEIISQFLKLQQEQLQLQKQELELQQKIEKHLSTIETEITITPEKQKALDDKAFKVKQEHDKEVKEFKELIKSLDDKQEINNVKQQLDIFTSKVNDSFSSVSEGFDTLKFNTQYSNNQSYFFIVVVFVILVFVGIYKFLRIFI